MNKHIHDWYEVKGETETIYWCHHCDATKDSDGGIIA
jgi:hypothetical protein